LNTQLENNETLSVLDGGELEVSRTGRVVGGTITTDGNGVVEGQGGSLEDVTNIGLVSVPDGADLSMVGTITNDGEFLVNSSSFQTYLLVDDAVTLAGTGSLTFSANGNNTLGSVDNFIGSNGIADTLTIGADQTLNGDFTVTIPLINNGTISPGASPGLVTFESTLTLGNSSNLIMEIDGMSSTERDRIVSNGALNLGGTLSLQIAPTLLTSLSATDEFEVISARSTITGSFIDLLPGERVIGTNGTTFVVEYGATATDSSAVMLKEFEPVSDRLSDSVASISGVAQGGTVTIVINGVSITITTNPGDTSAEVVAALAAAINGEFPGRARVIDNVLELTNLSIDELTTTDPGLTPNFTSATTSVDPADECEPSASARTISQLGTWHLLSVPCQAPASTTMATLIDDPSLSGDLSQWAAFTFNLDTGLYERLVESSAIPQPGTGFWFISLQDVTLTMPAGSVRPSLVDDAPCDSDNPCSSLLIEGLSGFNLVGNPLDRNVLYEEIQVTNDELGCTDFTPCSLDQSSIASGFFFYDEFSKSYKEFSDTASSRNKLVARPWDGFWAIIQSDNISDDWELHLNPYQSQFMFVTDREFLASDFTFFGGTGPDDPLNYADSQCQTEAVNGGLVGQYRAWISDSNQSPATEFNRLTTPYIRPDGVLIANSFADLTDGSILDPISLSPSLMAPISNAVWTATDTSGAAIQAPNGIQPFCNGWSSANILSQTFIGNSMATDDSWTIVPVPTVCSSIHAHLYCSAQ